MAIPSPSAEPSRDDARSHKFSPFSTPLDRWGFFRTCCFIFHLANLKIFEDEWKSLFCSEKKTIESLVSFQRLTFQSSLPTQKQQRSKRWWRDPWPQRCIYIYTLQGINISHLGKRKIIFKMPFWGDMLVPWRVYITGRSLGGYYVYIYICISLKTNMTTESHYFLIGDTSSFMVGFPASHVSFPGCIYGHILLGANIPTDSVCLKMIIFLFSFGGLWTSMDSFPGGYIQRMGIKGFISWQLVFSKIWECLLDPSFPPKHDSLSHD